MDYCKEIMRLVRGKYGIWLLAELPSGAWAKVWYACLDSEEMCRDIYLEDPDWFNTSPPPGYPKDRVNPKYETEAEALEAIILELRGEISRDRSNGDGYRPYLDKAIGDLVLLRKSQAKQRQLNEVAGS